MLHVIECCMLCGYIMLCVILLCVMLSHNVLNFTV